MRCGFYFITKLGIYLCSVANEEYLSSYPPLGPHSTQQNQ